MDPVLFTQLTDIHFGGDYNGMFPVEENFRKVIDAANKNSFLIITGDLADKNHEETYHKIKTIIEEKFGQLYAVLPGNHDDVKVLYKVFEGHTESFVYKGVPVSLIPTVWDEASGTQSGRGQLICPFDKASMLPNSIVFTHYPVLPTSHRFMSKHDLYELSREKIINLMVETGSNVIFCGHYHDYCKTKLVRKCQESDYRGIVKTLENVELVQYICPASQCQIDPNSDRFVCTSKSPNGFTIEVWPIPETNTIKYNVQKLFFI